MARAAKKPATAPAFKGFSPKVFTFFEGLAFYQEKKWFEENKPLYQQEVLQPLKNLLDILTEEMKKLGLPLAADTKRSIFRIHRDIRFSKDKTPYKTHAGAVLSRDGQKMSPGMVYIHISPEGCFIACGTYHPDPESLAAIRAAIAANPKRWLKICDDLKDKKYSFYREDTLKRLPRGYEDFADKPEAEYLMMRSFITRRDLPKSSVKSEKLVKEITTFIENSRKFLEFTWSAIDHARAKT